MLWEDSMDKPLEFYARPVLRISLALVFLYFGFQQISAPDNWAGYVPGFLTSSLLLAENIVIMNGIVELTLGIFLLVGLYTRISALVLGVHLIGITLSIGVTPTGIRDFGLAFATLALFLLGPDEYTLDKKFSRKPSDTTIKNV